MTNKARPEGHYAESKRADIRVFHGGFNVSVEIKKSSHQDLWSAIRNQLIAKYTRDPASRRPGPGATARRQVSRPVHPARLVVDPVISTPTTSG